VQRKLEHELGIPASQVPLDDFVYITRIHYLAPSDGKWGEHESGWTVGVFSFETDMLRLLPTVDYVVFATANVTLEVNPNEVSDVKWVNKEELEELFKDQGKLQPSALQAYPHAL
jgi:isopentenyl-diphosphate delta-isomerase